MATYIEMPKLADTMTEGTLVKWRKKQGDKVEMGDVLAEVETDKATMEMESFDDGILHRLLVEEGQKVPVGAQIALLLLKGEKPPAEGAAPAAAVSPAGTKPEASVAAPVAAVTTKSETMSGSDEGYGPIASNVVPATATTGNRVKSSPLARKLAVEKGIEISGLQGSGPGGRIVASDVQNAQVSASKAVAAPSTSNAAKTASVAPVSVASVPAGAGDQRIALSGMRRVIAERLLASKTQIPHFYLHIEIDAAPLMKLRVELNAASESAGGPKLTINDFVLKAVIAAAMRVPAVNASFAGDAIIQYGSIHLCVAVAVEEGLVTPVIRDAQKKSLREISESVKDLATRARGKKLKPDEYQGGTITVSNLGSYGIDSFSAIVNPPQAMIVSVGAIVRKPVVGPGDQIVAGQRMSIGLSADHRVVDGAIGAQYLGELRKLVESPTLMLL